MKQWAQLRPLWICCLLLLAVLPGSDLVPTKAEAQDSQAEVNAPGIIGPQRQKEDYGYLSDPAKQSGAWWEKLKYIPLAGTPHPPYLTLGGEIRLRYEWIENSEFGSGPQDNGGYLLSRFLPYASLKMPFPKDGFKLEAFAQGESAFNEYDARGPSPVDEEDLGLLQGFIRATVPLGDGEFSLQGGRQVISFGTERLLGSRYGTNILLSFDGALTQWRNADWNLQGFYLRPVLVDPDPLDDVSNTDQQLWGFYGTLKLGGLLPGLPEAACDFYYIGYYDANASYNSGNGKELRHTLGSRFFGKKNLGKGWLNWNYEGIFQFGDFDTAKGKGNIRAWSVGTETGYTIDVEMSPRAFLRANIVSGDCHAGDNNLETFNPLFPKGKYFGELTPVGPYNLINIQAGLSCQPLNSLTLSVQGGPYWRESTGDGVYGVGGNLLRADGGSKASLIGNQIEWLAEWKPAREWDFLVSYSQFLPGNFIDETGPAKATHFVAVESTFIF